MTSTFSHHSVADSLGSAMRVSGSPVVDMLVATLVSGLLLQHLPHLVQLLSKWLNWLVRRMFTAFVYHDAGFKHSVLITATSASAEGYEQRNAVHSPVLQSPDNLPVIMGALHYFQQNKIHFDVAGSVNGHIQPASTQPTTRERYLRAVLSFIPDAPITHNGLRFTFTTGTVAAPDNDQNDRQSSRYDDDDNGNNGGGKQRPAGPVATMTMRVDGDDLSVIQAFLLARMHEEVDLAYPAPEKEAERTFLYEMYHATGRNQQVGLQFTRSSFSTTKTFRTVFFQQKAALVAMLQHFEDRTGPWAAERERPHKLVILLEGPPGTGKSSSIKAIANLTKRHLLCLSADDIKDDHTLTRLFRDDTLNFIQSGAWRNEVVPHQKRLIVFEDIDCSGSSDWLMKRDFKTKRTVTATEEGRLYPTTAVRATSKAGGGTEVGPTKEIDKWLLHTGPTLGGLLNTLDGVCELDGHIVILTTNHADAFDPALLRPGRVDIRITMGCMRPADMVAMVGCMFDTEVLDEPAVVKLSAACQREQWTASDVQEVLQAAETLKQAVDLIVQSQPPSQRILSQAEPQTTADVSTQPGWDGDEYDKRAD